MSQFFRNWFSSASKPTNAITDAAQVPEAAHKLVESCLKSLPLESISTGDYYRLYRTLIDLSVEHHKMQTNLAGRTKLELLITHFTCVRKLNMSPSDKPLQLTSLNCELARWLVNTFPAVTYLSIFVSKTSEQFYQSTLGCLLFETDAKWARQLTSLLLDADKAEQLSAVLPNLTSVFFPQLKTLIIYAYSPLSVDIYGSEDSLVLPILPQLTTFCIDIAGNSFEIIWPTLKAHLNGRPPFDFKPSEAAQRSFWLHQTLTAPLLYEVLCTMDPNLATQIHGLQVEIPNRLHNDRCSYWAPPALLALVHKFAFLKSLCLNNNGTKQVYTLLQLLRPLTQLTALEVLKLFLKTDKQLPVAGEQISEDVKLHRAKVDIEIKRVRHGSFHVSTIVGLFPVARPIGFTFKRCQTCARQVARVDDSCYSRVIVNAREGDIQFK